MNNFEQNLNFGYYPEELMFDEKTQTFKHVGSFSNQENIENNEKMQEKQQNNQKNTQNFGNFPENIFSKMFEGNEMLSKMLAGGLANGTQKNNIIMQALNNLTNNKKKPPKEMVVESKDYFEEL